jgi:hypothetical protein
LGRRLGAKRLHSHQCLKINQAIGHIPLIFYLPIWE